jgi:FAD:protein FMN transferase
MIYIKLFFFSALLVISSSCTKSHVITQFNGKTMGTTYSVKIYSKDILDKDKLQNEVEDVLKEVNRQMSTYIAESEIDNVNNKYKDSALKISPWFAEVLGFSLKLAEDTGGVFDPTLGPLVNLWGFGPNGIRKVPLNVLIEQTKNYVGYKKVSLEKKKSEWHVNKSHPKVYIDLSATAKGFGVDKVSELLKAKGFKNHLVDIGGELRAQGKKGSLPWTVAIENPNQDDHHVILTLPLTDLSIATSGSYRNFFEEGGQKYSHTIDSQTGRPIQHNLVSVSILDPSCMKADGLATALHAMGPEKAWDYALKNNILAYFITASFEDSLGNKKTKGLEKVINVETKGTPSFDSFVKKMSQPQL